METHDLSEGGTLFKSDMDGQLRAGSSGTLELSGLGRTEIRIVAVSEHGCHGCFVNPDEAFRAALQRKIAAIHASHAAEVERVTVRRRADCRRHGRPD